ncbi:MAG: alpha/beta hydrolase [Micropruina sp.]|uniref:alpha/beta hydrolase n=1 Tax=Micropruina sp. TaxID=2737536 RepID=UPI0039E3D223
MAEPTWIERHVPGRHGDVRVREYRPSEPIGPRLVWVHGGGWVVGTLAEPEAHLVSMRVAAAGFPVTSVEYGLVPMFPVVGPMRLRPSPFRYPVSQDQVMDAWLDARATHGGPMWLGGASAGACLAAAVALRLRDGEGEAPIGLAFLYGLFHGVLPPASASLRRRLFGLADLRVMQEMVRRAAVNHVGSAQELANPHVFPGLGDLTGLPPVHLLNADRDILRASAENFAHRLTLSGVRHDGLYLPGTTHGFLARPESEAFRLGTQALAGWMSA